MGFLCLGGNKMFNINWKNEIFTIPNLLSLFRLMLIPVYIVIYLNAKEPAHYFLSAAILAVSCLTDMIDGKIARKFNMISTLGKILDPLADKITQLTLIICLAVRYRQLKMLFLLFFIKEMFQLIAGCVNLRRGKILKGALLTGKICTTVLFISLILMVMLPDLSTNVINAVTALDCICLSIAFVDYIFAYHGNRDKIEDLHPNTGNE